MKTVSVQHTFEINDEATDEEIGWIVATMTIQVEEPIDDEGEKARHLTTQNIHSEHRVIGLHKAEPAMPNSQHYDFCKHCPPETGVKKVPGGQGTTWVHEDTGAVAAPNPTHFG